MKTCLAIGLLVTVAASANAAQVVQIDATDRGFYFPSTSPPHFPDSVNYLARVSPPGDPTRNFFIFDLSGVAGKTQAAELRLYNLGTAIDGHDGFFSSRGSETYTLYDVTTPISTLVEPPRTGGRPIYDDLGSGTVYGSQTVSASDNGAFVTVLLNAHFVSDANTVSGLMAVGGRISGGWIFGYTGEVPLSHTQLVITLVPEPSLTTNPVNGAMLDFDILRVGTTGTETLGVTNTGGVGSVLSGSFPAAGGEFGPGSTSEFGPLGSAESDNRQYTYAPNERGTDTEEITVTSNGGDSEITLSGTGVGPVFDSSLAAGSTLDFDTVELGVTKSFFLDVSNITTDASGGDATLTDLTLLAAVIRGFPDPEQFDIIGFTPGTVLHKDDILSLEVSYNGTGTLGMKNAKLSILTDEEAAFGTRGLLFNYRISANVVPEPSTIAMAITGLLALLVYGWRKCGKELTK